MSSSEDEGEKKDDCNSKDGVRDEQQERKEEEGGRKKGDGGGGGSEGGGEEAVEVVVVPEVGRHEEVSALAKEETLFFVQYPSWLTSILQNPADHNYIAWVRAQQLWKRQRGQQQQQQDFASFEECQQVAGGQALSIEIAARQLLRQQDHYYCRPFHLHPNPARYHQQQ